MEFGLHNNIMAISYKVGQAPWEIQNNAPAGSFPVGKAPWEVSQDTSSTIQPTSSTFGQKFAKTVTDVATPVVDFAKTIGSALTSSEQNVGSIIGQSAALNTDNFNQAQQSIQGLGDMIFKTEQQIKQDKLQGKDTSYLESLLANVKDRTKSIADVATIAPDTQQTNLQGLGSVVGVATDVLSAGLGGITKGGKVATVIAKDALQPVAKQAIETSIKDIVMRAVTSSTAKTVAKAGVKGAAVGYGYDLSNQLQSGSNDFTPGMTTVVGALGPVAAEALSTIAKIVPVGMVKGVLPKLKTGTTLQHVLDTPFSLTTNGMIQKSNTSLANYGNQIKTILSHPEHSNTFIPGSYVVDEVLKKTPGYEYTAKDIFSKLKTQLPSQAKNITALEKGSINIQKANELRSALDGISYKSIIDSPEIKASKELAGTFGNVLRNFVKTQAPETISIFDKFSKEINMNKALQAAANKLGLHPTMKDMLAIGGGYSHGGAKGAIEALIAERLLTNPAIVTNAGKLIQKTAPVIQKTGSLVVPVVGKVNTKGNKSTDKKGK